MVDVFCEDFNPDGSINKLNKERLKTNNKMRAQYYSDENSGKKEERIDNSEENSEPKVKTSKDT